MAASHGDLSQHQLFVRDKRTGAKLYSVKLTEYNEDSKKGKFHIVPCSGKDRENGHAYSHSDSMEDDFVKPPIKPFPVVDEFDINDECYFPPDDIHQGKWVATSESTDVLLGPVNRAQAPFQWLTTAQDIYTHSGDTAEDVMEQETEPMDMKNSVSRHTETTEITSASASVALSSTTITLRQRYSKRRRSEDIFEPSVALDQTSSSSQRDAGWRPNSPSSGSSSGISELQSAASNKARRSRIGKSSTKMHSRYKGVGRVSSKCNTQTGGPQWRARMSFGDQRVHIGCYTSEELAAKAYDAALVQYKGEKPINFPQVEPDLSLLSDSSKRQNKIHSLKNKAKSKTKNKVKKR